ncbi:MAG: T9SS type A sorting domain-containing protein, partial [Bacteroidales bacterium]
SDADFDGAFPTYELIPNPGLDGTYSGDFTVIDEYGCSSDANLSFTVAGMPAISGVAAGDFVWAGFEGEEWNADTHNWFEFDGTDYHYSSDFPEEDKNVHIVDYCSNPNPEINNAPAYCHDLNIAAGKSLSMSSSSEQTLHISGDWNNEGTFDAGISTLNFNGDSDQYLSTVAPGGESFYKLSLNQDGGSQLIVNQDLTITNELNITSGIINTNANTLSIDNPSPASLAGGNLSGSDGFIKGRLQRATDGSSTYNFPIGYDGYGAQGFDIKPNGNPGAQVLAFMEPFTFAPVYPVAYCDVEVHPGGGSQNIGDGDPGYDGIPDKIVFDLQSPLQWDVSNPGGGITTYDIDVYPSGAQMISPVVSANGESMLYLMKNGEPGNTGVPAGDQYPWFEDDGFLQCPTQTSLADLTSFSKFNLLGASGSGSALPVELLSFSADYDGRVVNLAWTTASERNNDYFEVQKSENAQDFVAIDKITSLAQNGNSNTKLHYNLTDEDTKQGTYYYRLKQVDFDGSFAFSDIVSIIVDGTNAFLVYPNPAKERIQITYHCTDQGQSIIRIYDPQGRLVHSGSLQCNTGTNKTFVDVSGLSPAVYTLTLITDDGTQQTKLIKH